MKITRCYRVIGDLMLKIPLLGKVIQYSRYLDEKIVFPINRKFVNILYNIYRFIKQVFICILRFFYIIDPKTNEEVINIKDFKDFKYSFVKINKMRIRFIALLLFTLLSAFAISYNLNKNSQKNPDSKSLGGYIASIKIDGVISGNKEIYESLKKIRDNDSIKAVILEIDSPGGNVEPSEKIYNLIRKIDEKKPVVVSMQSVAASGGYMIALAGRYIFAEKTTITGSIGVYTYSYEMVELAKKLGIKANYVKSSKIKGSPQPFEEYNDEINSKQKEFIADIFDIFKSMVGERRNITGKDLDLVTTGGVFLGEKALKYKLVDEIGDEEDALQWLKDTYPDIVGEKMKVEKISLYSEKNDQFFLKSMINGVANAVQDKIKSSSITNNVSY